MRKFYTVFFILITLTCIYAQPKLIHRNLIAPYVNTYVPFSTFYPQGLIQSYYVFSSTEVPNCMMSLDTAFQVNWEKTVYIEGFNTLDHVYMSQNAVDGPDNIYQLFELNNATEQAIARIDHNGVVLWAKKFTIGANNRIVSKMNARNNCLYILFSEADSVPNRTIMKMDNAGNILWQKRFFSNGTELAINDLKVDAVGNIYLYGIESGCFFNMMFKPDGSMAYANTQCTGIITETGLLKFGEPIGNNRNIVSGQLFQGGLTTALIWGATDTNGIINSFSMYADTNIFYDSEGIGRTTDNTVLIAGFRYDSTLALNRSLWLEVDSTGNPLSAQSRLGDSLHVYGMQVKDNNMVVNVMQASDNFGYMYSSIKDMSLCRPFVPYGHEIDHRNTSTFIVEHNILSIDNVISFNPSNVSLSDITAIQLTELCSLHLQVEENKVEFNMYPNPTNDNVWIDGLQKIDRIECFTLTGSLVKTIMNCSTKLVLPTNDLSPGIYMVRVTIDNHTSLKKLIKL